jgi:hypothetical protein
MSIPTQLRPLAPSDERRWCSALIEDARMKLALDLDPMPTLERGVGLLSRLMHKIEFMVVGGSHASRTARVMSETGYSVVKIIDTNWRIDRSSCEALATTMVGAMKNEDPEVVVLQLLDNSIYYTRRGDGSRVLPKKLEDGHYHVEGELVVASSETQFEHYQNLKPVFDAVGKRPCILIAPLPRYVSDGCCQKAGHVANRSERGYKENMEKQLEGVARKFKNLLFHAGKRYIRVLDPGYNLKGTEMADVWGVDPVHPIEPIYKSLVASIFQMAATLKAVEGRDDRNKRRREASQEDSLPRSRRPREDGDSRREEGEGGQGREDSRGRGRGWTPGRGGFRGYSSGRGYGGYRY